jgi:hypothetical protein
VSETLKELADRLEREWYDHPRPSPHTPYAPLHTLYIEAPAKLLSMNVAKSTHYRAWALMTAKWRARACEAAILAGIGPLPLCVIRATPHQRRAKLADPGAHMPCVKACIDGLRDAGSLADDTGAELAEIRLRPPIRGKVDAIVLEILRPDAERSRP